MHFEDQYQETGSVVTGYTYAFLPAYRVFMTQHQYPNRAAAEADAERRRAEVAKQVQSHGG